MNKGQVLKFDVEADIDKIKIEEDLNRCRLLFR